MPSNVAGWPYPLASEPVRDGAAAIQALATALSQRIVIGGARIQAGQSVVTTNAFGQFSITTPYQVLSAFPTVLFQDGDGSTAAGAWISAAYYPGPTATISGFVRNIASLGTWFVGTMRVNWLVVG